MEQKVLEVAPYRLHGVIEQEYAKGWFIAAITAMCEQKYLIVFQRYEPEKELHYVDHRSHQRNGYIAKP